MQTPPFFKKRSFKSRLKSDQIVERLTRKLSEKESADYHFYKGKRNGYRFRFYRVSYINRNSFNPQFYLDITPGQNDEAFVVIKARIAYPIYILWLITFAMEVEAAIMLVYDSFSRCGLLGALLMALIILLFFFGVNYLFYRFGFKKNAEKTIAFLKSYLQLID